MVSTDGIVRCCLFLTKSLIGTLFKWKLLLRIVISLTMPARTSIMQSRRLLIATILAFYLLLLNFFAPLIGLLHCQLQFISLHLLEIYLLSSLLAIIDTLHIRIGPFLIFCLISIKQFVPLLALIS